MGRDKTPYRVLRVEDRGGAWKVTSTPDKGDIWAQYTHKWRVYYAYPGEKNPFKEVCADDEFGACIEFQRWAKQKKEKCK